MSDSAAPAALAFSMSADLVATLSLTLSCLQEGPLVDALLPRTPDPWLNAATSLFDLLLAALLRSIITLAQLAAGRRAATAPGLAAASVAHALICSWLIFKAGLAVSFAGGGVGGYIRVDDVTLGVTSLICTEALGVLFSGVLLTQAIASRRALKQRAPPDALSFYSPLAPDARDWLDQRHSNVHRWLETTSQQLPTTNQQLPTAGQQLQTAGPPPPPRESSLWLPWKRAGTPRPSAAAAVQAAATAEAAAAERAAGASTSRGQAGSGAAQQPLLSGTWESGDSEELEAYGDATSRAAASSSMGASFCTAASQPGSES